MSCKPSALMKQQWLTPLLPHALPPRLLRWCLSILLWRGHIGLNWRIEQRVQYFVVHRNTSPSHLTWNVTYYFGESDDIGFLAMCHGSEQHPACLPFTCHPCLTKGKHSDLIALSCEEIEKISCHLMAEALNIDMPQLETEDVFHSPCLARIIITAGIVL